jgi:hypothetical protein
MNIYLVLSIFAPRPVSLLTSNRASVCLLHITRLIELGNNFLLQYTTVKLAELLGLSFFSVEIYDI